MTVVPFNFHSPGQDMVMLGLKVRLPLISKVEALPANVGLNNAESQVILAHTPSISRFTVCPAALNELASKNT